MSGLFIRDGLREAGVGRLVTFEGSRAMAEIAAENYRTLGFNDISIVIGDFDRQFGPALDPLPGIDLAFVDGNHRLEPTVRYDAMIRRHGNGTGVIVHDDLRWSTGMNAAWRTVRKGSGAKQVYDLFRMGVIELGPVEGKPRPVSAWLGIHS
jgi:predicted O-methyltransferase YrrM